MSLPNLGALRLTHRPEAGTGVFAAIKAEDAKEYWKDAEPTEDEKREELQEDEIRYKVRQIRDPSDQEGIPFDDARKAFWVTKDPNRPEGVRNKNWHRAANLARWVADQLARGRHPLLDPYKAPLSNEDIKQLAKEFPEYDIPEDYDNTSRPSSPSPPQDTNEFDDIDESERPGIVEHANERDVIAIDVNGKWDPASWGNPDYFSIKYEMKKINTGLSGPTTTHSVLWNSLVKYFLRDPETPVTAETEIGEPSQTMNVRDAMELPKPTLETLLEDYRTDEGRNPTAFANDMCILGAHLVYDACGESLIAPGAVMSFFYIVFEDRLSFGWQFVGMDRSFYQALKDGHIPQSRGVNRIRHFGLLRKLWSVAQKTLAHILWANRTTMEIFPRNPMFDEMILFPRDHVLVHGKYYYDLSEKEEDDELVMPTYLDQLPQPQPPPPSRGMLGHMLHLVFGESVGDA